MKTVPVRSTRTMENSKKKPGIQSVTSSITVKRSGKTKVRAVPDFSKLHQKWETKLQKGKACTKKACTKVEEFHLSTPGTTTECVSNVLNENPQQENMGSFTPDAQALKSIKLGKGVLCKTPVRPSGRVPVFTDTTNTKHAPANKSTTDTTVKKSSHVTFNTPEKVAVKFESDASALQSILHNRGLTATVAGVVPARQTLVAQRTPVAATPSFGRTTEVIRKSIYYTGEKTNKGPVANSRKEFYTEFSKRVVSRLQQGENNAPGTPTFAKPMAMSPALPTPQPVVTRVNGSIYCKVQYFPSTENRSTAVEASTTTNTWKTATPRSVAKAARVPVPTPSGNNARTPATGRKTACRELTTDLPNAATPAKHDALATRLIFPDDDEEKLQCLEAAEKQLEAEIAAAQSSSSSSPKTPAKDTPAFVPSSDANASSSPSPAPASKPVRHAFGVLTQAEIACRSEMGFNPKNACKPKSAPHSPSPVKSVRVLPASPHSRMRSPKPLSPLVKGENKKPRSTIRSKPCKKLPMELDQSIDIVTVNAMDKSTLETSLLYGSPNSMSPATYNVLQQQVWQAGSDKKNSSYPAFSPLRKIWDKENISPQNSPLKHTAVDLEKYKIDAAILALCSPNAKENLHHLSLYSPNRASPSPNQPPSSPVSAVSSPNKRARKMSSPVSAKKTRKHKLSPRSLTSSYASFNENNNNKDVEEKKSTVVKAATSKQDQKDNKTIQDISQSIKQTVSLIDDLNQTFENAGSDMDEAMMLQQMQEIKLRQQQLLDLQNHLSTQRQLRTPKKPPCTTSNNNSSMSSMPVSSVPITPATLAPASSSAAAAASPSLACTPSSAPSNSSSSQNYADFIAAHVEDISPYDTRPRLSRSRMPFQMCGGAESSSISSNGQAMNTYDMQMEEEFVLPMQMAHPYDTPRFSRSGMPPSQMCVGAERSSSSSSNTQFENTGEESALPMQVAQSVLETNTSSSSMPASGVTRCVTWSSAASMYSPMSGLQQLMQNTVSPAPINTPLAMRGLAERRGTPHNSQDRDLLEISSLESSLLDSSRRAGSSSENSMLFDSLSKHEQSSIASSALPGSGQVSSSSLMTTTLSFASPRSSYRTSSRRQGSLSLAANLTPSTATSAQSSPISSYPILASSVVRKPVPRHVGLREEALLSAATAVAEERYHEAMLDDEVERYCIRLANANIQSATTRPANPVAQMLMDGDDMHFIVIPEPDTAQLPTLFSAATMADDTVSAFTRLNTHT